MALVAMCLLVSSIIVKMTCKQKTSSKGTGRIDEFKIMLQRSSEELVKMGNEEINALFISRPGLRLKQLECAHELNQRRCYSCLYICMADNHFSSMTKYACLEVI